LKPIEICGRLGDDRPGGDVVMGASSSGARSIAPPPLRKLERA